MRVTVGSLRQIIREELDRLVEYEQIIVRRGSKLYIRDDEGNEDYYGPASDMPGMQDGESVPLERGYGGRSSGGYGRPRRSYRRRRRW